MTASAPSTLWQRAIPQKNLTGAKRSRRQREGAEMVRGITGGSVRDGSVITTGFPELVTKPPPAPPEKGKCPSIPLASFPSREGSGVGWLVWEGPMSRGICRANVWCEGAPPNGSGGGCAPCSLRSYDSAALTRSLPPAPAVRQTPP